MVTWAAGCGVSFDMREGGSTVIVAFAALCSFPSEDIVMSGGDEELESWKACCAMKVKKGRI